MSGVDFRLSGCAKIVSIIPYYFLPCALGLFRYIDFLVQPR